MGLLRMQIKVDLTYDGTADIKLSVQVSLQESAGVATVIFKTVYNRILSLLVRMFRKGNYCFCVLGEIGALWMAD